MALIVFPWIVRFYERVSTGRFFDKILGWIYGACKKWIACLAVTTDEDAIPVPTPPPAEGTG